MLPPVSNNPLYSATQAKQTRQTNKMRGYGRKPVRPQPPLPPSAWKEGKAKINIYQFESEKHEK